MAVPPLLPEEARDLLVATIRRAASSRELDRLVELCRRIPLALAVAAARINRDPRYRMAELVELLDGALSRLDLLTIEDDPDSDLGDILDGSFRALDADCARVFRAAGVVGYPLGPEAASSVASLERDGALRAFRRLTDLHLMSERLPDRFE